MAQAIWATDIIPIMAWGMVATMEACIQALTCTAMNLESTAFMGVDLRTAAL